MNTQYFPLFIVFVMLSLGLSLTIQDFRRVAKMPWPIAAALFCQSMLLPSIAFLIANLFTLPPTLAIGLMLISAVPGGTLASIFSHLGGGDLALNLSLTAINSLLAIVTLPATIAFSAMYFLGEHHAIVLQYSKLLEVVLLMAMPAAVGIFIRGRYPRIATAMERPVKFAAGMFVLLIGVAGVVTGWSMLKRHIADLGTAVVLLNFISLIAGYIVSKLMRLDKRQAIAISIEIGLHNAALAITIASSPQFFGNAEMAAPAALYGVLMPFVATAFILVVKRIGAG